MNDCHFIFENTTCNEIMILLIRQARFVYLHIEFLEDIPNFLPARGSSALGRQ